MPSIKGTSSVEDSRALSKALKGTKFPSTFHQKVDVSRVNRPVLVQWIERKINECLGFEDEIVQSTAVNLFLPETSDEGMSSAVAAAASDVDPRKAQIALGGFLGEDQSAAFCAELWDLMLDAATQAAGIPRKLLEEKKKELAAAQKPPLRIPQKVASVQVDARGVVANVRQPMGPPVPLDAARQRQETRPVSPIQQSSRDRGTSAAAAHNMPHDRHRRASGGGGGGGGGVNYERVNNRHEHHRGDDRRSFTGAANGDYDEYGRYRGGSWRQEPDQREQSRHHRSDDSRHRHYTDRDRRHHHRNDNDDRRHHTDSRRSRAGEEEGNRYDDRRRREPRRHRSRSPPSNSRRSRRGRSSSSSSSASYSSSSASSATSSSSSNASRPRSRPGRGTR